MNIHEYQAKELFRNFGLKVPKGKVAHTPEEAAAAAQSIGGNLWVVKGQIHAGGRGKAGGVRIAHSVAEVRQHATEMLGKILVTYQTGSAGRQIKVLLIEEGCDIEREYYIGMALDRSQGQMVMMASSEGGVDIEDVAQEHPEKIFKAHLPQASGFTPFVVRKLAYGIGLRGDLLKQAMTFFQGLYQLHVATECLVAEINPLVVSAKGELIALDAKLNFDDNALFRHPEISKLRDVNEESDQELEASKFGLSYISLDGNIGCLVNGAGLAMATMDIIQLYGGRPANFLDVGGGATKEAVETAFKIILADPKVKAILVNIFGGIMKCDIIAEGVVAAARSISLKVPLVVRLEGTNVALGKKIIGNSELKIIAADDLTDAAKKVVEAAKLGAN